jgi:hypothetical protein
MENIDFSKYRKVFCDSLEALQWSYSQGLSNNATILTSSPAMLWSKESNIIHIESIWNVDKMKEFQETIQSFSEKVYDSVVSVEGITHEESLCIAQVAMSFHRLLFKASCLTGKDLSEECLFISVASSSGKNMNTPWDRLLSNNLKFKTVTYTLKNDKWGKLTTEGISLFTRIRVGGLETLIYRLLVKLMGKLPRTFFNRQVLIPNENELLIETATHLAMKGIQIREIKPNKISEISVNKNQFTAIKKSISFIVNQRLEQWVDPSLVLKCEEIFFQDVEEKLNTFLKYWTRWKYISKETVKQKKILFVNAASNINSLAIASVCRENGIKVVSAQHGVSKEICATHGEVSAKYDTNVSDLFLVYNAESKKMSESSHFSIGCASVVGISARHQRMSMLSFMQNKGTPIVYVSTNLYRGNLSAFSTWETDYDRSLREHFLITNVFGRLPHKVLYKAYPEENRRYADEDPVIKTVLAKENIELFSQKVDMRYLISKHRILVTSLATSTLGWLVMSGKPVVFINRHNDHPLTKDAHISFSKGLFLFDDIDNKFYEKLYNFLSLPIDEIEKLWRKKKSDRKCMINKFFTSSCSKSSGKIASRVIFNKYFKL